MFVCFFLNGNEFHFCLFISDNDDGDDGDDNNVLIISLCNFYVLAIFLIQENCMHALYEHQSLSNSFSVPIILI